MRSITNTPLFCMLLLCSPELLPGSDLHKESLQWMACGNRTTFGFCNCTDLLNSYCLASWLISWSITWSKMMELGISLLSLCATIISPSGESKAADVGVRTISAPRARSTFTFSFDIFSGITMMQRYLFIAAANAKPKPNKTMVTLVKTNVSNKSIFQTVPTEM